MRDREIERGGFVMFGRRKKGVVEETHPFLVDDVEVEIEEFDGSQVEFELANELRFLGTYADDERRSI